MCQAAWNTLVIRELNLVAMRLKGGLSVPVETAAPTGLTPDKRWIMDGWIGRCIFYLYDVIILVMNVQKYLHAFVTSRCS